MISIRNLNAAVVADGGSQIPILRGIDLEVQAGEVHAIMGPNGSGKSTLARVVGGHPSYVVTAGSITYEINMRQRDMIAMEPDVRAKNGVFIQLRYRVLAILPFFVLPTMKYQNHKDYRNWIRSTLRSYYWKSCVYCR